MRAHAIHLAPRGAVLLECVLAVAVFVGAGLAILALVDQAGNSLALARESQSACDLARSAMARLEAGIATPDTLAGPVKSLLFDPDSEEQTSGWELEVLSEPSEFPGLSRVTVKALRRPFEGADSETVSFSLTQLVRLERRAGP